MKKLHVICFNNPYPPNYGGVIDLWHKLKALHSIGAVLTLHVFEYGRERHTEELLTIAKEVYFYSRKHHFVDFLSSIPYITKTRMNKQLEDRLLTDNIPILCEGMHTSGILFNKKILSNKKLYLRMHNNEPLYYKKLAFAEKNFFRKFYHFAESLKLKSFEKKIEVFDKIFTISEAETTLYHSMFPQKVSEISAFHPSTAVNIIKGSGNYILYHGNLSVSENSYAALFLIKSVFSKIKHKVIISGYNPPPRLINHAKKYNHISLIANPNDSDMNLIIRNAHINILHTFQPTGTKLKLLNVLFNGRHCIVNQHMLSDHTFKPLVNVAQNGKEYIKCINKLMQIPFEDKDTIERNVLFAEKFDNVKNAQKMLNEISSI